MKKELTQLQATAITWIIMIVMIIAFIIIGFSSCSTTRQQSNEQMYYILDTMNVDKSFVDSICKADTLGTYPSEWTYSPLRSYEENKDISTYGWMKSSNWTFYRVIKDGNEYRVTIRSIK